MKKPHPKWKAGTEPLYYAGKKIEKLAEKGE